MREPWGIKANREQDGSGGISRLHLPPTPVRDLFCSTLLDPLGDRFACECLRLLDVGHLKPFLVGDVLVRANETEIAAHDLSLRRTFGTKEIASPRSRGGAQFRVNWLTEG